MTPSIQPERMAAIAASVAVPAIVHDRAEPAPAASSMSYDIAVFDRTIARIGEPMDMVNVALIFEAVSNVARGSAHSEVLQLRRAVDALARALNNARGCGDAQDPDTIHVHSKMHGCPVILCACVHSGAVLSVFVNGSWSDSMFGESDIATQDRWLIDVDKALEDAALVGRGL